VQTLRHIPVKGFIESSFVDWPGKLAAVLFLPRCNFRCPYCHNADLVTRPEVLRDVAWEDIQACLERHRGWIDGVCVSGGEPTLQPELPRMFALFKRLGFLTKLDTNGSNPDMLAQLLEQGLVDYVAMDVKSCLDKQLYCRITRAPHMFELVKRSIRLLLDGRTAYEFRVTVVPTYHAPEDIYRLAVELNGARRLRIQNFYPSDAVLDAELRDVPPFSDEEIVCFQQRVDDLIAVRPQ
jgi:pyruvate formate lyase activating enzyme